MVGKKVKTDEEGGMERAKEQYMSRISQEIVYKKCEQKVDGRKEYLFNMI